MKIGSKRLFIWHRVSVSMETLRKWIVGAIASANWFRSTARITGGLTTRSEVRPVRLYRRRHGQTGASALCRFREHLRPLPCHQGVSCGMGQADRLLQRQAWRIPHHGSVREGPNFWPDAVWPSALRAQYQHHLRQHPAGQGGAWNGQTRRCRIDW